MGGAFSYQGIHELTVQVDTRIMVLCGHMHVLCLMQCATSLGMLRMRSAYCIRIYSYIPYTYMRMPLVNRN